MKLREMTLKELQDTELEILEIFRSFCEENGLTYILCGGTLLGAVRHRGFIPWDDDIDLQMPRPDYERLLDLAEKTGGMIGRYWKVDARRLNPDSPTTCIRIFDTRTKVEFENYLVPLEIGCWIDIFPLDGVEDDERQRIRHFKKVRRLMDLFIICHTRFGGKRRNRLVTILQYGLLPALPFIRLVGYKRFLLLLEKELTRCDYETSSLVAVIAGRASYKETMNKEDMWPAAEVEYEGRMYPTMKNYDEYLTNLYGDYMTPPEKKDRESRHQIKFYRITEQF